jgi:hypothetical protein
MISVLGQVSVKAQSDRITPQPSAVVQKLYRQADLDKERP